MDKFMNELGKVAPEQLIVILAIVIILDVTTGIIKAFVFDKSFTSEYLRKTVPEHFFSAALLPFLFYINKFFSHMDILNVLYIPIFLWFMIAYLTSLLANLALLGVPFPVYMISYLKKEIESKGAILSISGSSYKISKGNTTVVQSNNDEDVKTVEKLVNLLNAKNEDVEANIFNKVEENKNKIDDQNKENVDFQNKENVDDQSKKDVDDQSKKDVDLDFKNNNSGENK